MNSLAGRLRGLFVANAHESIDHMEDPATMSRHLVRELAGDIDRMRQALVMAIAAEKELEKQAASFQTQASGWEQKARSLLTAGKDAEARDALSRRLNANRNAETLAQQLETAKAATARMRKQLDHLRREQNEARSKSSLIALSARASDALRGAGIDTWTAALRRKDQLDEYARRAGADDYAAQAAAELQDEELDQRASLHNIIDDQEVDAALESLRTEINNKESTQ